MTAHNDTVVILIDIQADFTEYHNGALAVPNTTDDYVRNVIEATHRYKEQGLVIIATQDYHPMDHQSFWTNHPGSKVMDVIQLGGRSQTLWPPHCVQGTPGAEILVPADLISGVVQKGTRQEFDSYSGFRDDGGLETGLKDRLREIRAESVIIYGLATDYCVKATVLHALEEGFRITVKAGLCRGITQEGSRKAFDEMRARGAVIED